MLEIFGSEAVSSGKGGSGMFPSMRLYPAFALISTVLATSASALTLLRDTVDMRASTNLPSLPLIPNPGTDSLRIDSVTARAVRIPTPYAQLVFYLDPVRPGASSSSSLRSFNAQYQTTTGFQFYESTRFSVSPKDTADLKSDGFDECVFCPLAKQTATAALGDTLKAWVFFHSAGTKDSVLFLSIHRNSTAIAPYRPAPTMDADTRLVDPTGRKVERPRKSVPALVAPR
jgi:hypothetical protein